MEKSGEKAGKRAGKAIADGIAEEAEKGGKKAADKYAGAFATSIKNVVRDANKEIERLDFKTASEKSIKNLEEVKKTLKELNEQDFSIDFDERKALAKIATVREALDKMRAAQAKGASNELFHNLDKTVTDLDKVSKKIEDIAERKRQLSGAIEIEVDTKPAERQMGAFERSIKKSMDKAARHLDGSVNKELRRLRDELDYLGKLRVGIDIGATQLKREVGEIQAELKALTANGAEIDVKVESGGAWAELAAFDAAVERLDGKDAEIDVKVNGAARAVSFLERMGLSGDRAANSFRSFNVIAFALSTLGPALIPMLAGVAGGLIALGPAAAIGAAGLGSVLVGFSGLGDALTALGNQQDQAAMTAQTSARSQAAAARSIRDAEEALSDARRNAARAAEAAAERVADAQEAAAEAVEDALERQKDAQEAYRDSVQAVADAERALAEARRDAAGTGEELDRDIRENALAIDQALLNSFNATVEFNAVSADGSATNAEKEQARINREEALLALENLRAEQEELQEKQRKWRKEGVNGVDSVKRAQGNLTSAIEAQQDALENLRDASEAVDEARIDGARAVRDALEAQRETAEDNARAIADAQQNLADANASYADSLNQVNAQQNAVNNAMEALGPAGRKFALFLFGLRGAFLRFRDDVQSVMLPAVQEAIEGFMGSGNAKIARSALIGLAAAFGEFAKALSVSLQGEAWGSFFRMLRDVGPTISQAYGEAFISFMEAMATLLVATAPFAVRFAEGFARMMDAFARWTESARGQEAIQDFLAYVQRIGPAVLDFFGQFARAFGALARALAPLGETILTGLTEFFRFIADMNPRILQVVATTIVLGVAISQLVFGAASLVLGIGALMTTFGAWIVGIIAVIGAIIYLWNTNEGFRNFMIDAWERISAAYAKAWDVIKPALADLWDALEYLWKSVLEPFFSWLGPKVVWAMERLIPLFATGLAMAMRAAAWYINNWFIPAWMTIARVVMWAWEKVISPVLRFIVAAFKVTFNAIKAAWTKVLGPVISTVGKALWNLWKLQIKVVLTLVKAYFKLVFESIKLVWERILKPVWDAIAAAIGWLWKKAIKPYLGDIEDGWDNLMRGMKWVWRNVLKPVFDFIADKALPKLEGAFDTAVRGIKKIWEGLKAVVATPIAFVLETVINDGLIAGFNKVASWVKMDGINEIKVPQAILGPAIGYATGGILPGYTPGRDVHEFYSPTAGRLHLSGGEAIMRPEFTAAVGPEFINTFNAAARAGGVDGVRRLLRGGQAFAKGGIFFPVPGGYVERTAYNLNHDGMDINHAADYGSGQGGVVPFISATSGVASYVGYGRGYGNAVFVQSPYGELVYGHAYPGSIGVRAGMAVQPGQYLGLIGNTGNSSGPHLHFGFPGGTFGMVESLLSGAAQANAVDTSKMAKKRSVPGFIKDLILNPISTVKGWIIDKFSDASDSLKGNKIFEYAKNVPLLAVNAVKDKALGMIPKWAMVAAKGVKKAGETVKDVVTADPGKDVSGGIVGGNFGSVNSRDEGGYKNGGILPYNGTMKYDSGGYLPPGLTSVINLTGRPEPVFTADQWDGMTGPGGGNIHYEPHFEGSDLTAADVAADLNFAFRRLRRGGKYESVGS